jgi:putative ABC transport system permease protein
MINWGQAPIKEREMFELERAIQQWKKALWKNEALEDGYVAELESHLRDEIGRLIASGKSEERAFKEASAGIGETNRIADDYYKTSTRRLSGRPPWKKKRFIPELLANYFKITIRKIRRQKGYSFINIFGLAIGMACTILILLWVQYELSFDKHHEKADRIYRVGTQFGPTSDQRGAFTAPPMAQAMLNEFPEVLHAVRLDLWDKNIVVRRSGEYFTQKDVVGADGSVFDVFTIPFIKGNPDTALTQPGTIVLTEDTAHKYFPDQNPLGLTLSIGNKDYQVTGVVENCPLNSHFHFEMLTSLISEPLSRDPEWDGHCYFTYIVLPEGYNPSQLETKFPEFIKKHYGPEVQREMGISFDDYYDGKENYYGYWLQPLWEIYLLPGVGDNLAQSGSRTSIFIFTLIAVFILVIACINFMNLSSAKAISRASEVGIRKVMGSSRAQLVRQFLLESILLSFIALLVSIGMVEGILPAFNVFSGKHMNLQLFQNIFILFALMGLALSAGLMAGLYPALLLSSFRPAAAMKGRLKAALKGGWFRKGLVIFQFAVSLIIILGALIIFRQLNFVHNASLGFDKENIVVVHTTSPVAANIKTFREELLSDPNIVCVSNTNTLPGRHFDPNDHQLEQDPAKLFTLFTMYADSHLLELLNIELSKGRYFSQDIPSDALSAVVINEAAVKELGLEDPLGTRFVKDYLGAKEGEFVTVIGVVKDFNFISLHHKIHPMVIRPAPPGLAGRFISIKIRPENIKETLAFIENIWKAQSGGLPFEYSFLADDLDSLYRVEQKTGQLFTLFSFLAVLIASLGLFGLASYTAEQRTKEIGIRKVLGASISGVVVLLDKEYTKLVLLANLIAWPLAYFMMHRWLQNFAFRANLGFGLFLLSSLIVLLIALLSVSFHSLKAALSNPVDSLRYE